MSYDYSASMPHNPVKPVASYPGASRVRRVLGLVAFMVVMLLMAEMLRMGARPHPHGATSNKDTEKAVLF